MGSNPTSREDKLPEAVQNLLPTVRIDGNDKAGKENTLLYYAIEKNDKGVIKLLLDSGADMTAKKRKGKSPLDFAIDHNNQEIIMMLTYRKISVPADSSSLFWASTLAYLIPVRYDFSALRRRCEKLFGNADSETVKIAQEIIQRCNPTANYAAVHKDKAFKNLVTQKFRNKVIDEMCSLQEKFQSCVTLNDILRSKNEGFFTEGIFQEEFLKEFNNEVSQCGIDVDVFKPEILNETSVEAVSSELDKIPDQDRVKKFVFTEYVKCMRDSKSWGGSHEIQAMSDLLHCNVHVFSDGVQHSFNVEHSSDRMQLLSNGELRYNFGLIRAPVLIAALKSGEQQEAETHLCFGIDDADYRDGDGWSALHFAAQYNYVGIITSLLAHGANISSKNSDDQTPLDVAKLFGKGDVARVLDEKFEIKTCAEKSEVDDCSNHRSFPGPSSVDDQEISEEMEEQPTTYRRSGEGGIGGQIYEIELSMLFLLQGITKKKAGEIESFYLATNFDEADDFDDVVFIYRYKDNIDGSLRPKIIFLQAKHRENPTSVKERVTFEKLFSNAVKKGNFTLKHYFASYLAVKSFLSKPIQDFPIPEGNFDDLDCDFVIYTNASSVLSKTDAKISDETESCRTKEINKYLVKEVNLNKESSLYLQQNANSHRYYKLILDGDWKQDIIDVLRTSQACKKSKLGKSPTEETVKRAAAVHKDPPSETDINNFLSRLKIFVEQPGEEELGQIIKQKIQSAHQVEEIDSEAIFSGVRNKVEMWWKEQRIYLTEADNFFEESAKISIFFDVKKPTDLFIGREKQLNGLHEIMQRKSGKVTVISQKPEVGGTGGIGKTELAVKYVCKYSGHYDNNIVWINAENKGTLVDSFLRLAQDKLKIKAEKLGKNGIEIESVVEEVNKYFSKRKNLFIFDNAGRYEIQEDGDIGIDKCLQTLSLNGKTSILITSRSPHWDNADILYLDVFTEEEAEEFIQRAMDIEPGSEVDEVKLLSEALQYFPLAMKQAATYIKKENAKLSNLGDKFSNEEYLAKYAEEESRIEKLLGPMLFSECNYAKAAFITWKIALEKITQTSHHAGDTIDILDIIAYFAPNSSSTETFFKHVIRHRGAISSSELLRQYSSITLGQGETEKYELIQQVLSACSKEMKDTEVLRQALELLRNTRVEGNNSNDREASYKVYEMHYANHDDLVKLLSDLPPKYVIKLDRVRKHVVFCTRVPSSAD